MKKIAVLGSTGSIGTQTLDAVRMHPQDFCVTALSCGGNTGLLEKQAREFHPRTAAVYDEKKAADLRVRLADTDIRVISGMDGLLETAESDGSEILVTGIVGMIGIRPTIAAIRAGKDIALANKETCVAAGHLIMPLSKEKGVKILPVDSEHSAIFQCLEGRAGSKIRRILLTASGGPFFGMKKADLEKVTVRETLRHPTWTMGPKVTVDSATMVNKGLEMIEAKWLFGVGIGSIEPVIQRESLIHSAVEFEDGSVIAQMGPSDMRIPIQYALTYPKHEPSPAVPLDFTNLKEIHFDVPDNETFRGIPLAVEASETGGSMPTVFNASNEWANRAFREGRISFMQIYEAIEKSMASHKRTENPSVDEILSIEQEIGAHLDEMYGRGSKADS